MRQRRQKIERRRGCVMELQMRAAGLVADAAGECWVRRGAGFAFRSCAMIPREALAKARHPWAKLRKAVGLQGRHGVEIAVPCLMMRQYATGAAGS